MAAGDPDVDRMLRIFATVVLDEINLLRERAGLQPRTRRQWKDEILARFRLREDLE